MQRLTLPHDGPGTHALVVAVPVNDDDLCDPAAHARLLAQVTARAREALTDLAIRPDLPTESADA